MDNIQTNRDERRRLLNEIDAFEEQLDRDEAGYNEMPPVRMEEGDLAVREARAFNFLIEIPAKSKAGIITEEEARKLDSRVRGMSEKITRLRSRGDSRTNEAVSGPASEEATQSNETIVSNRTQEESHSNSNRNVDWGKLYDAIAEDYRQEADAELYDEIIEDYRRGADAERNEAYEQIGGMIYDLHNEVSEFPRDPNGDLPAYRQFSDRMLEILQVMQAYSNKGYAFSESEKETLWHQLEIISNEVERLNPDSVPDTDVVELNLKETLQLFARLREESERESQSTNGGSRDEESVINGHGDNSDLEANDKKRVLNTEVDQYIPVNDNEVVDNNDVQDMGTRNLRASIYSDARGEDLLQNDEYTSNSRATEARIDENDSKEVLKTKKTKWYDSIKKGYKKFKDALKKAVSYVKQKMEKSENKKAEEVSGNETKTNWVSNSTTRTGPYENGNINNMLSRVRKQVEENKAAKSNTSQDLAKDNNVRTNSSARGESR